MWITMILTQFKVKKKLFILMLLTSILFLLIFFNNYYINLLQLEFLPASSLHWNKDIDCHYIDDNDVLQSAGDPSFSPPPNSIFFHETSCAGDLNSRQLCAIESAARVHKNWQVYVLFSSPINSSTLSEGRLKILKEFKNVNLARVHLLNYIKGTVLESLMVDRELNKSTYSVVFTADVLRYLSLYKFGGVYLDLDVVVTKDFGVLAKNWAARESSTSVNCAVVSFSRDPLGRRMAEAALRDIKSNFRVDIWGHLGPGVITRVLQKLCSTKDPTEMNAAKCDGFEVYDPQLFYPIYWTDGKVYLEKGDIDMSQAYMFHVWNHMTESLKVDTNSPYAKLAMKYCPTTFKNFKQDFGF